MKQNDTFDFTLFYKVFKKLHNNSKAPPSSEWLQWLIGFTEGDGSFSVFTRKDRNGLLISFHITQHNHSQNVLYDIKEALGIGNVYSTNSQNYCQYTVANLMHINLIISLFNNNILLPTKKVQFKRFVTAYNLRVNNRKIQPIPPVIKFSNRTPELSLEDAWLSGFTDAEGCFYAYLKEGQKNYKLQYCIVQKYSVNKRLLKQIMDLFKTGSITLKNSPNVWSYNIYKINSFEPLINYLNRFPLKTKKKESFQKWVDIREKLQRKDHLDVTLRKQLIAVSKTINNQETIKKIIRKKKNEKQ
jgi:LAGLIDADG endonuclease